MGPKTRFGSHIARSGGKDLFSETTFKTSNENTNTKAKAIPSARLSPNPPRFFADDKLTPKMVRMITETGIEVL